MRKVKTHFVCQKCGYQTFKWLGKCPGCQEWNTLMEEVISDESISEGNRFFLNSEASPVPISEIISEEKDRIKTGIEEFDRVLGGGIVLGSVILIGGDPGIGKSTLLLQVMSRLAMKNLKILYISGEESIQQTKLRADRLGISSNNLYVVSKMSLENILDDIQGFKPSAVVVDSIQTVYSKDIPSVPGSITQVRIASQRLLNLAKNLSIPIFIVGHVTKEGFIAGPKVLEHIVDTVLYIEGESHYSFRLLRPVKNRFGSTNEVGVFEMKESGLEEVRSPSEFFLSNRVEPVSGSVVVACLEGLRPILVELQALVVSTNLGFPRRTTQGIDPNRVSLLVAVMEKRLGIHLYGYDIFLNITGGIRIIEPGIDLGVITSILSSYKDKIIDPDLIIFGEVGLGGEIRGVTQADLRVKEAARLGFKKCLLPKQNEDKMKGIRGVDLIGIKTIDEARKVLFNL